MGRVQPWRCAQERVGDKRSGDTPGWWNPSAPCGAGTTARGHADRVPADKAPRPEGERWCGRGVPACTCAAFLVLHDEKRARVLRDVQWLIVTIRLTQGERHMA